MIATPTISLRLKLASAVTTAQSPITGQYVSMTNSGMVTDVQPIHTVTNDTTEVTIVPNTLDGNINTLKSLQVLNLDSAAISVIIEQWDGTTARQVCYVPLLINQYMTVNGDGTISISSTGGVPGTGTVTQVQGNGTVGGLTLSGNVTTTGNLTLGGNLTIANATQNGIITSSDWNTFNNKSNLSWVQGNGTVNGLTLTGNVSTNGNLTLGGSLSGTASSLTAGNITGGVLAKANGGTAATSTVQVLQRVVTSLTSTGTTTAQIPSDNTTPQNTEGTEITGLATTFTPLSASSTLEIQVCLQARNFAGVTTVFTTAIFKDTGANAIYSYANGLAAYCSFSSASPPHREASGSTTARTYKVRVGNNDGTSSIGWNPFSYGGVADCKLIVTEYL